MDETGAPSHGPIWQFMVREHERLDSLLERVRECKTQQELAAYDQFRRGLLRHIAMEEKVLLPAAEKVRGRPIPQAAKLRLDHGALAALMMPSPQPRIVRAIRYLLLRHNPIEEGPGQVYDACEELVGDAADDLLAALQATPQVPVKPNLDTPKVFKALRHALARAGYDEHLAD